MSQNVTIKASHLLWHSVGLVIIGAALIVLQIAQLGKSNEISATQKEIRERIIPVCLSEDTQDVCERQVDDAPDKQVRQLCVIVLDELDLPTSLCGEGGGENPLRPGSPSGSARDGPATADADAGGEPLPTGSTGTSTSTSPAPTTETPTPDTPDTPPNGGGAGGSGGGSGGSGGGSGGGGGGSTNNGTCVLLPDLCVNVPGEVDDELLPDQVPGADVGGLVP